MSIADREGRDRSDRTVDFDQHTPQYRAAFPEIADAVRDVCPVAWSPNHGGFWVVTGHDQLTEMAKHWELVSNHHDVDGSRPGFDGITIPSRGSGAYGGFLEMDPPDLLDYRKVLNPHLSPAAVKPWGPMVEDLTTACIDDVIETGRIDFVDDLANVVPAVLTMGMLGLPLTDWVVYCDPIHAQVYTPPTSPDFPRVMEQTMAMVARMTECVAEIRQTRKPGMIQALVDADFDGRSLPDQGIISTVSLLMGGGFDTTTSLLAGALDWLDLHPAERPRLLTEDGLIDTATEEFLRWFTPAQGGGRTITQDCTIGGYEFKALDRVFMSYALSNHDPAVFENPDEIVLDRWPNRHAAFGLGVHRCIGSNLARQGFKVMLTRVLERMPDFRVERDGIVQYESIGTINGYQHVPATFTPGARLGPSVADVIDVWQARLDAEPIIVARPDGRDVPA